MSRVQFRQWFRKVAFAVGVLFALVSPAGAQTALVDELSSFKPPYQIVPAAITQLPDGRIYGFYRGGLFGAIYKVTPNGSGGYVTTVVYEFGPGQAGPADGFMVNATAASVVVAAPDGSTA